MASKIMIVPKTLPEKRKLLKELREQRAELKKHLTKENEALYTQLGDFIKLLEENIKEHNSKITSKLDACNSN